MKSNSDTDREVDRIRFAYARRSNGDLYSCFAPGQVYILQEFERRLLRALTDAGVSELKTKKVLEVGCGTGYLIREFIKWGAQPENVIGVDLLTQRVERARALCASGVRLYAGNANTLSFPDSAFDIVVQSTVFTSILDDTLKREIAAEMLRVLRPNGLIVWYDYHVNNPWNPAVRGVPKNEIFRLFPECSIALERITLFPQLTRLLARYSWLSCYILSSIPVLCTHYLGLISKNSGATSRRGESSHEQFG